MLEITGQRFTRKAGFLYFDHESNNKKEKTRQYLAGATAGRRGIWSCQCIVLRQNRQRLRIKLKFDRDLQAEQPHAPTAAEIQKSKVRITFYTF